MSRPGRQCGIHRQRRGRSESSRGVTFSHNTTADHAIAISSVAKLNRKRGNLVRPSPPGPCIFSVVVAALRCFVRPRRTATRIFVEQDTTEARQMLRRSSRDGQDLRFGAAVDRPPWPWRREREFDRLSGRELSAPPPASSSGRSASLVPSRTCRLIHPLDKPAGVSVVLPRSAGSWPNWFTCLASRQGSGRSRGAPLVAGQTGSPAWRAGRGLGGAAGLRW
jgi:hypothetical protein